MINRNFDDITFRDITLLIEQSVTEGRTLDYKRTLPGNSEGDKKEFLQDVASFTFAGGDIVFGLGDKKDGEGKNTGTPEYVGLSAELNIDQEKQRLQNIISEGIKPRLPLFQLEFFDGPGNRGKVAVLRIPKSWAGPHMVSFKTTPAFFSRSAAGKIPLDVNGIREAFVGSEQISQRIQDFRNGRVGAILANDSPVRLHSERRLVMHTIPLQSIGAGAEVNLRQYQRQAPFAPSSSVAYSMRFTPRSADRFLDQVARI